MNFPSNLKYTKDHEWLLANGNEATVGITDFAQKELGDIVFVDITTIGQKVLQNEIFGSVEAVKTVSDLFIPVTATILEFNKSLENNPEAVNTDPYGAGWMVKITIENVAELDGLLSAEQYKELVGE